jgi:nuclear pore complex protein Nup155
MATPQRQLPGGFLQTPAPIRPSLVSQRPPSFRLPSNPTLQRHNSLPGAASNLVPATSSTSFAPVNGSLGRPAGPLHRAAIRVNDSLAGDQGFPALDDYILQGISAEYDSIADQPWSPFEKTKDFDIPDRVLEQLNGASASIEIGLFADIHHAWAIVDNVFYLWDYTHPNPELSGFDDIHSMITLVKLAKPKPGVFQAEVTHVILIASVTEFIILGLTATTSSNGVVSVSLYQTDLKLPTKGIDPSCLATSSKSGRIFLGCENSDDIYEITYQNEEKWFSSKCGKINHTAKAITESINPGSLFGSFLGSQTKVEHTVQLEVDDSRDLLYALSSTSRLRIFHIKDNNSLQCLVNKPWGDVLRNVAHSVGSSHSKLITESYHIASISPIPKQESSRLALMATTITGVRIFFSLTSGGYYFNDNSSSAPSSMQVHHVKFPPPTGTPASPGNPQGGAPGYGMTSNIDTNSESLTRTKCAVRFSPGLYFNVVVGQNADSLYLAAPETAKIATLRPGAVGSSKFVEVGQWVTLGNAQIQGIGLVTAPFKAASVPLGFGNEMAVQYDQTTPEIAVITNMGIHVFRRNRLVDTFSTILKSCTTEEEFEERVKKCCRDYSRTEACATALAVACGQSSNANVATDPVVIDLARRAFIEHGGSPDIQDVLDNSQAQIDNVRPSPRAIALMLYVSRLVRSAWKLNIITESTVPGQGQSIKSTVPIAKLQSISQSLMNLQQFLDTNKTAIPGLSGPDEMNRVVSVPEQIALQGENRELDAQMKLIRNAIEGIAFLIQLFERPVVEILMTLPEDQRANFRHLSYEALFTTDKGKLLAKEVVKAIVSRSIADGSNVDTVADTLRRRCGSFCSADDVVIFKAQEHLQRAINTGSETAAGRSLLNDSMKLFQKVAGSLSTQYLEAAVAQYVNMSFYAGKLLISKSTMILTC